MANPHPNIAGLTMADMARCHRVLSALDEIDTSVQSASMPGKAAVRHLLRLCFDEVQAIMRKGANGAVARAARGRYQRDYPDQQLWQRILSLASQRPDSDSNDPEGDSSGE